jgi:uncharacterized protein YgiM (DUF1202 family)
MINIDFSKLKLMVMEFGFTPENPDEISVKPGEQVYLIGGEDEAKETGWAQVMNKDGNDGFVPYEFLKEIPVSEQQSLSNTNENSPVSHKSFLTDNFSDSVELDMKSPLGGHEDLKLSESQNNDDDIFRVDTSSPSVSSQNSMTSCDRRADMGEDMDKLMGDLVDESAAPGKLMVSEFAFQGETDGVEISVSEGEEVYIINESEAGSSGWALVVKKDGSDGYVPFHFLKEPSSISSSNPFSSKPEKVNCDTDIKEQHHPSVHTRQERSFSLIESPRFMSEIKGIEEEEKETSSSNPSVLHK